MAVTFDALGGPTRVDNLDGSTSATTSHSHTVAGADRYIVHCAGIRRLNLDIASGSYNSVAYTLLATHDQGTTTRSKIFGLAAPATGANTALLTSSGTADDIAHGSISLTGVHQTTPAAATPITFGGTAPSSTIATADGGMVVVCVSYQTEATAATPPTAGTWTQQFASTGVGDAAFYCWTRPGDGTTFTINPGGDGTNSLAVTAISLAPSASTLNRGMTLGCG